MSQDTMDGGWRVLVKQAQPFERLVDVGWPMVFDGQFHRVDTKPCCSGSVHERGTQAEAGTRLNDLCPGRRTRDPRPAIECQSLKRRKWVRCHDGSTGWTDVTSSKRATRSSKLRIIACCELTTSTSACTAFSVSAHASSWETSFRLPT